MKTITLKLTELQIDILQSHLIQNICSGSCYMKSKTGHLPKSNCFDGKCKMMNAVADIREQLDNQLRKED